MKTVSIASAFVLTSILIPPPAHSATTTMPGGAGPRGSGEDPGVVTKSSDLLRLVLLDTEGRTLAKVDDVILEDDGTGTVAAIVLVLDRRLAPEPTLVAAPVELLRPAHAIPSGSLVIGVDAQTLASAPAVTNEVLARIDSRWLEDLRTHFGVTPLHAATEVLVSNTEAEPAPIPLARLRQVLGKIAVDADGEDLARIIDLALDLENASVRYAVLAEQGGSLLRAVPWDTVSMTRDGGGVQVAMKAEAFSALAGFDASRWPACASSGG